MTADVIIQIVVDSKGAVLGEQTAVRSLSNIEKSAFRSRKSVDQASSSFYTLQKAVRLVDGPLGGVAARFETLNSITRDGTKATLALVTATAAAGFALTKFAQEGEKLQNLQNKLRLVTNSSQELARTQQDLFEISQRARVDLTGVVDLYSKLARSASRYGIELSDVKKVTELVAKATATAGAPAQSTAAALFQLSQGLAANRLSGQELNSILEQAAPIAAALESGLRKLGFQFNSLKKFAEDGNITFANFNKAILASQDIIERDFGTSISTVSQSIVRLNNAMTVFIGGASQASGFTVGLAKAINLLADNLDKVLAGLAIAGGAAGIYGFARLLETVATTGVIRFTAAMTAMNAQAGLTSIFALATTRITSFSAAATVASGAAIALSRGLVALVATLGPVGAAIGLAVIAYNAFNEANEQQAELINKTEDQIDSITARYGEYKGKLNEVTVALRQQIAAEIDALAVSQEVAKARMALQAATNASANPSFIDFNNGRLLIGKENVRAELINDETEASKKFTEAMKAQNEAMNRIKANLGFNAFTGKEFVGLNAGFEQTTELSKEAKKAIEDLKKSLEKLVEDTRTPLEEYQARLMELQQLEAKALAGGMLTPEVRTAFERAEVAALKDYEEFANEDLTKLFENTAESIQGAFRDSFKDIFRNGAEGFSGLTDKIKDLFINMLADLAVLAISKPIIVPAIRDLGGALGLSDSVIGGVTSKFGGDAIGEGLVSGIAKSAIGKSVTSWVSNTAVGKSIAGFFGGSGAAAAAGSSAAGGAGGGAAAAAGLGPVGLGIAAAAIALPMVLKAFKNSPSQASELYAETGVSGLTTSRTAAKTITTEFADGLTEGLSSIVETLNSLTGVSVSGLAISGGRNSRRKGGFFDITRLGDSAASSSIRFDPNDSKSVDQALAKLTVELAKLGTVTGINLQTALKNINTEGRTFEEVLEDISFANMLDNLTLIDKVVAPASDAINELNKQVNEYIDTAKRLGLAEEQIAEARDTQFMRMRSGFNSSISGQILGFTNPAASQINELNAAFAPIVREAIAVGGDLALVEELYGLRRQEIVEGILGDQEQAYKDLSDKLKGFLLDIQAIRDGLALDPTLGGLNRQGRAGEAQNIFDRLQARVLSGDVTSLDDLQKTTQDYLNASLDYFGPTETYLKRLEDVYTLLDQAEQLAKTSVSVEEKLLQEQMTSNTLLEQIAKNTKAAFAALGAPVSMEQLLRKGESASVLQQISPITGLDLATERSLKARVGFDFSKAAEGYSFADFVKTNRSAGESYLAALELILGDSANKDAILASQKARFPGFASGTGNAAYSGMAMVGEQGPELVNFGRPAQVFSTGNTQYLYAAEKMVGEFAAYRQQSMKETEYLGAKLEVLGERFDEFAESVRLNALKNTAIS